MDRIAYALLGSIFGTVIGGGGWWLYGLGHSLNYNGPGMDPVLRHWLVWSAGAFGAAGFILREYVADALGDTINAVLHFESNSAPRDGAGALVGLVFTAIIVAAIWFTVP